MGTGHLFWSQRSQLDSLRNFKTITGLYRGPMEWFGIEWLHMFRNWSRGCKTTKGAICLRETKLYPREFYIIRPEQGEEEAREAITDGAREDLASVFQSCQHTGEVCWTLTSMQTSSSKIRNGWLGFKSACQRLAHKAALWLTINDTGQYNVVGDWQREMLLICALIKHNTWSKRKQNSLQLQISPVLMNNQNLSVSESHIWGIAL